VGVYVVLGVEGGGFSAFGGMKTFMLLFHTKACLNF
jgi:hypothetical protein